MRTVVLANGVLENETIARKRIRSWNPQRVIAADGGSRYAIQLGLTLDLIIGDLDSVDQELLRKFKDVALLKVPAEKDETDLELALRHALTLGSESIVVLGAAGRRLDMTLANLLLLTHADFQEQRIELWHGSQTAWIIRPPGSDVHGAVNDTLSLIPLDREAAGITTHNLKYPLQNETLFFGPARGVSNLLSAPEARVDLASGLLLAVHTSGRA